MKLSSMIMFCLLDKEKYSDDDDDDSIMMMMIMIKIIQRQAYEQTIWTANGAVFYVLNFTYDDDNDD